MRIEDALMVIVMLILGPMFLFLLYAIFVLMPYSMYVDIKCKEAGYPKSDVTINLQGYCMTLEGVVQSPAVPVEKAKK